MRRYSFGIRQRVLIITLLPLTMITLLLGGYFINTRLDDAQSALIDKGQTMAQMMATSAEFGLLVGNTEILQGLIRSATKTNEVDDIVFLTPTFETLVRGNKQGAQLNKNAGYPLRKDNQVYFLHPVVATGVDIIDTPDFLIEEQEPEFIGWVVIILSEKPTQARQLEILIKGIILAFIGLLVTVFIASRFGQRITNPILGLTHVIEMLQHGHLETRASLSSTGELRSLAQGINRLAQRVQESNQTLESRVDKATKRLRSTLVHLEKQNQALDKARKNADSANIAKDEFLARMSHELRTPLTSVSGFARLLDQTELSLEQQEYTRIINLTSSLLLSIIDDILDYSKLESNAVELEQIAFDFEACILDVLEMQTAAAHEKGLEFVIDIAPETPKLLIGDPVRLKQIISNLVSNAVKFTDSGYICIHVEQNKNNTIKTELKITVEDTGVGIPNDCIDGLFQAFSQADTSITRRFGGSGLGLVISKRLTELMKGNITLSSQEGKGTSIRLTIPFTISPHQQDAPAYQLGRVILFDRMPLVRRGVQQQLAQLNADITEVTCEEELLKLRNLSDKDTIIWGLNTKEVSKASLDNIQTLLQSFNGRLILLCGHPLPLALSHKVIQLRKPPRTQLLLNALFPEPHKLLEQEKNQELCVQDECTILVAEDNDFNRLLVRKILEQSKVNVIEAITGEQAIQQTTKYNPDLILMDVHMPVMDGIEATRQIRLVNNTVPIVALTANVITSEHQKLMNAGVNHVLLKPINDHELCHTIEKFLASKSLPPQSTTPAKESLELEKYNIDNALLTEELNKQIERLMSGFQSNNLKLMKSHCHQLLGLAGLYEIPELEAAGHRLHDALHKNNYRDIWKALWQIKRIIKHEEPSH
ncbi:ATP-binding protein [Neptuniibacter sp. 2_MG-2023]|uniref:ATP-binding protein n=1 Tax=Neptuniibacter sp. 2_MG-2023 TaxID=3062671 RepID=UPI0026E2958E|nr:ATP-binding protein [Neptuniibacter sp. 2_MG-2023]MDO6514465.1 ATP-binding protein [Neptuniibacter sp. 2_MG-2023]